MTVFARSKEGRPREEWHPLQRHLQDVASLASKFASKWDSADWGYYAGLWHDLGKFSDAFQRMICANAADAEAEAPSCRVNHSSAGALRAMRDIPNEEGLPLAFV